MAQNTPGQQLFDLLVTRGFDPEMLDSSGKAAPTAEDAEIYSFEFVSSGGTNHGTVVVMLGDDKNLELFSGDNVGRGMDSEDKTEWYEFQHQLKNFATKNFMTFGSQNINRLKYSMQGQAALKEGLYESWNGTKNISWNGGPDSVRLMIRHKRPMGIDEARFRQVESLFLETAEGERYKLPFRNLAGGRAMVEHVRQGGRPYDMRGQHIANMVEELNVLSRFRRASQGRVFEGDTANLVTETNQYYSVMSRTLKGLSSARGYNTYFESWNPADITEQDVIIEDIKTLFVQETIDSRIEQALPILARIQQQGTAMKEANIFEAWANNLLEGTWATPDTPEEQQELIALLSQELPVGADATNATEQLYSLVGDDILFDQLQDLAEQDPNADCRSLVIARIKDMADKGFDDFDTVLDALKSTQLAPPTVAPAEPTPPVAEQDDEEYSVDGGMNNELLQDGMLGTMLGGAAGAALTKSPGGAMTGAKLGSAAQDAFGEEETDGSCNYTAEGEHCPEHGLNECGSMYEGEQNTIARLQELAGMRSAMSEGEGAEQGAYPHDFQRFQNDAQAYGFSVVKAPQDQTGNGTQNFQVLNNQKQMVGFWDGNAGNGIITKTPQEYQQKITSAGGMSNYGRNQYQKDVGKGMIPGVAEGQEDSPVASAITRRILMQRSDLLSKYGPEKVTAAIDEVADFVGDVEEIGSSDVSGWIKQIEQMLGNIDEQGSVDEASVAQMRDYFAGKMSLTDEPTKSKPGQLARMRDHFSKEKPMAGRGTTPNSITSKMPPDIVMILHAVNKGTTITKAQFSRLQAYKMYGESVEGVAEGLQGTQQVAKSEYSALSGQYGHSGKLQKFDDVEEDVLHRLRQLSGMIRSA
jgi:hypothetical protein